MSFFLLSVKNVSFPALPMPAACQTPFQVHVPHLLQQLPQAPGVWEEMERGARSPGLALMGLGETHLNAESRLPQLQGNHGNEDLNCIVMQIKYSCLQTMELFHNEKKFKNLKKLFGT